MLDTLPEGIYDLEPESGSSFFEERPKGIQGLRKTEGLGLLLLSV